MSDSRIEYSAIDISWTALAIALLLFVLFVVYVIVSQCDCWESRRKTRHVIRHIIIEPIGHTRNENLN